MSSSTCKPDKQPLRRKRTLNFNNAVSVKLIPTLWEMSDAEYSAVYYTDVEFQALREATMDDVRELRYQCSIQSLKTHADASSQETAAIDYTTFNTSAKDNFCHRGIEHLRSVATNQHRRQTRRTYVYAVLAEQDIQYTAGYHEPMALSRVASNLSSSSRVEAIRKGGADAIEARRVSGMSDKMARALQALHEAADLDEALADEKVKSQKVGGSKLSAIRSVRRPLGSVRMRSLRQNAAVA